MDQPTPSHAFVPLVLARAIQTYLGQRPAEETAELFAALKVCPLGNLTSQAPLPEAPLAAAVPGNDDAPRPTRRRRN